MIWINLATVVAVLIESIYISIGHQQNKKSKQTDLYCKTWGDRKRPTRLSKENHLPLT